MAAAAFHVRPEAIGFTTTLALLLDGFADEYERIGAMIDFLTDIEAAFGIELAADLHEQIETVGELIATVNDAINRKKAA